MSDRNGIDAVNGFAGFGEGLFDDGIDGLNVTASGDFGNNATIFGVNVDLRHDNIGQDFLSVLDDCGGGFVARRFNPKNFHKIHYTTG